MKSEQDFYFTIERPGRASELKVKGSRFIACIFPVTSKSEIQTALDLLRKEFYDATHHCYAYRLGTRGETIRAADDGEPSGTAGKPILLALSSRNLNDCLLVVVRYYGGTNLGTGGLARAYLEAAQLAVGGAAIRTVYLTNSFTIRLGYEDVPRLEKLLASFNAKTSDAQFGERVVMKAEIRKSLSDRFKADILDTFYGKVIVSED
ncbi:MAG: IMPACT family protein [Candidatus Kapaibacterium sp.]